MNGVLPLPISFVFFVLYFVLVIAILLVRSSSSSSASSTSYHWAVASSSDADVVLFDSSLRHSQSHSAGFFESLLRAHPLMLPLSPPYFLVFLGCVLVLLCLLCVSAATAIPKSVLPFFYRCSAQSTRFHH